MNLIKLNILVLIEKYKKVTEVAKVLDLKQPTVTFHMKSLEEEMGIALFEARRGRIWLTDAGMALYPYAVKMTGLAEEAKKIVHEYADLGKGMLHIGADHMTGTYLLPQAINRFCREYPGIEIEMTIKPTRDISEMLKEHAVDAAFFHSHAAADEAHKEETLWNDEFVVIFSPNHTFSKEQELTHQMIAQQLFVQHAKGTYIRDFARAYAAANRIHLWERASLDSPEAIKKIVQAGEMVSIFPRSGIREELAAGSLMCLPLPDKAGYPISAVLAFPSDQPHSPLREQFKQFIRAFDIKGASRT